MNPRTLLLSYLYDYAKMITNQLLLWQLSFFFFSFCVFFYQHPSFLAIYVSAKIDHQLPLRCIKRSSRRSNFCSLVKMDFLSAANFSFKIVDIFCSNLGIAESNRGPIDCSDCHIRLPKLVTHNVSAYNFSKL